MRTTSRTTSIELVRFELRYETLSNPGHAFVFACEADGSVDPSTLTGPALASLSRVRSLVGREFAYPVVTTLLVSDRTARSTDRPVSRDTTPLPEFA